MKTDSQPEEGKEVTQWDNGKLQDQRAGRDSQPRGQDCITSREDQCETGRDWGQHCITIPNWAETSNHIKT